MSRIAPGRLVEAGAALDPHRLGHGDLDVVDELAVPDRLEDAVREAQRQHVLHRLLAEVVVDPEDLVLAEPAVQQVVQLAGRREVVAERLLDDQPHPAFLRAPLADLGHRSGECLGWHGEVVEPVAAGAALGVELLEHAADAGPRPPRRRTRCRRSACPRRACPTRPAGTGRGRTASPPSSSPPRTAFELCGVRATPTIANCSGRSFRYGERVQRRDELPLRQVARRAEDHDGARLRPSPQLQALEQRVRRPRSRRRQRARLGADAVEQLGEGVGELLHALRLERRDDVVVVDAGGGEIREQRVRLVDPCRQAAALRPRRDPGTPAPSRAASC